MIDHTFAICAFKQSPYLEECIKSLLSQTVESEIIIVTSTINEYINNIAKKYDIEVYSHNDYGIANDWNFALKSVKTKFCTLAHQDDIYLPDYLKSCLDSLRKYSIPLIAFTDYLELKNEEVIKKNINLKIKRLMLFLLHFSKKNCFIRRRILSLGNPICCPAVTYNLYTLKDFKFDSNLTVSLDWDAWERISKLKGYFCYISKPLFLHRIHELSETTNAIGDNRRTEEDIMMLNRFWSQHIASFVFKLYSKSQNSNSKK